MIFLVHADTGEQSIASRLGQREYSYFFVLDGFRKALEKLGTVIDIRDPCSEVDKIWEQEEDCIFLSFTPPNHANVDLKCPTLSVFAWEFSNIPYETWDEDPRNDWRYVFKHHGRAISLSSYSAKAVTDAMGEDFPVAGIPVPVWDGFERARSILKDPDPLKQLSLRFEGHLLGPDDYSQSSGSGAGIREDIPEWNRRDLDLEFNNNSPHVSALAGFHPPEPWGVWSGSTNPFISLPVAVSGKFSLTLQAHALPPNADRDIPVSLGSAKTNLRLSTQSEKHILEFDLAEPANQFLLHGVKKVRPEGSDKRYLGIGLSSLSISDPEGTEEVDAKASEPVEEQLTILPPGHSQLNFKGVIYTSVFNPSDGRKNWVDLVSAFCYAHRDHEDACLVLKMVTNDPESYMGSLPQLLTQLAPFKCRVVAIRGFLPQDQFENLVAGTTYYVNTSHCEGLCLPLMEFLSAGVPAVAPDHTAMADYINDDLAFRVASGVEQNVWPDDPRDMFRTLRYRINWESLYQAYSESYRVARDDPDRYRDMSREAREQLREYASIEAVAGRIAYFLGI